MKILLFIFISVVGARWHLEPAWKHAYGRYPSSHPSKQQLNPLWNNPEKISQELIRPYYRGGAFVGEWNPTSIQDSNIPRAEFDDNGDGVVDSNSLEKQPAQKPAKQSDNKRSPLIKDREKLLRMEEELKKEVHDALFASPAVAKMLKNGRPEELNKWIQLLIERNSQKELEIFAEKAMEKSVQHNKEIWDDANEMEKELETEKKDLNNRWSFKATQEILEKLPWLDSENKMDNSNNTNGKKIGVERKNVAPPQSSTINPSPSFRKTAASPDAQTTEAKIESSIEMTTASLNTTMQVETTSPAPSAQPKGNNTDVGTSMVPMTPKAVVAAKVETNTSDAFQKPQTQEKHQSIASTPNPTDAEDSSEVMTTENDEADSTTNDYGSTTSEVVEFDSSETSTTK